MAIPAPKTVEEKIAWSYANLARAHAALDDGASSYSRKHHIIRNRLYYGLIRGAMQIRSIYDDEKLKISTPQCCVYCGAVENLSIDHLIPRIKGGVDYADNLVCACKSCNSSKNGLDLMEWHEKRGMFPSLMVLRRYLKLVARLCEQNDWMTLTLSEANQRSMPFDIDRLPAKFPPLDQLVLNVMPIVNP